jgi:flagellar basal-body rod protein FlgB
MSGLFDATLQGLERGLDVASRRQAVLSSNLANLDTPNYVPKDVDFKAHLRRVTAAAEPGPVATKAPGHLRGDEGFAGPDLEVKDSPDRAPGQDGNAVDLDRQLALATNNAGRYGALARAVQKKTAALRYVLSQS